MNLVNICIFLMILVSGIVCQDLNNDAYSKGDKVNLTCPLSGDITWFKNDKEIKKDAKKYTYMENVLQFIVDKEMNGIFLCDNGDTTINVTLNVKPYVDQEMKKDKNTIQDEMLVIECKGFGFPTPQVTWSHKPVAKEDGSDAGVEKILVEDDRVSFRSDHMLNNTLRIRGVKYEDAGLYTCNSVNDYGNSSFVISVKVKDKFAALWPFLAIVAEVAILCTIIFIYEKRRAKRIEEEEKREEADHLTATNDVKTSDDVRHRK